MAKRTFLEFFSGGGMARLGLGDEWTCLFANDRDAGKCAAYRANFGGADVVEADASNLALGDLPARRADLAWASFPCQDLSLAGARAGLSGTRSGAFFEFLRLLDLLAAEKRAPRAVVIENVAGLLTSNGGADFGVIARALASSGYRVSALVLNASCFVPQSRARLFIFGLGSDCAPKFSAHPEASDVIPRSLLNAVDNLPVESVSAWRWLPHRPLARRNHALEDLLDRDAIWSEDAGAAALAMMSLRQRALVERLRNDAMVHIGAAFRRVRTEKGARMQRIEARFDGLAGCLRTPAGGSSRQMLLKIDRGRVAARLLTPREAARLMGLPEEYSLPAGSTAALALAGDGVAVPVVRWIAEEILEPALARDEAAAA